MARLILGGSKRKQSARLRVLDAERCSKCLSIIIKGRCPIHGRRR